MIETQAGSSAQEHAEHLQFKVPGRSVNFACMRTRTALRLLLVELAVAVAAR